MLHIEEYDLELKLKEQFLNGMEEMKQRMLQACENGIPINIEGRAYFIKSDMENLRDIFADLEDEAGKYKFKKKNQ